MDPWTSSDALLRAFTPVGALESLLRAAGRRLAGRRVTVPGSGGELSVAVRSLSLDPQPAGLALGQLDDLRLVGADLRFRGWECHRAVLVCRNLHVRPFPAPVAVAAPVMLELAVTAEELRRRVGAALPAMDLELLGPGRGVLRWRRHPSWGALTVSAEVAGSALLLRPRAVSVGRRRVPLPGWVPARRLPLPEPPRGLRLREVVVGGTEVVLHLVADEWREELPLGGLERLLARLT